MNSTEKFNLSNKLGYFALIVLFTCFFLMCFATLLPKFPNYPTQSGEWEWFVSNWNLAGPLLFVMVFRIHAFRAIREKAEGRTALLGITRWVKFWFAAAIVFGIMTLSFVSRSYLINGFQGPMYETLGVGFISISWLVLIFSSLSTSNLSTSNVKCERKALPAIKRTQKIHQRLLFPASIIFLIFTGLSSLMILFP
jgi:hypothetical protein